MPHVLRPGLSFCVTAGTALFLDLPHDRYFRLPDHLDTAFQSLVAGEPLGETALAGLVSAGVLETGAQRSPIQPIVYGAPAIGSPFIANGAFHLGDVARAIIAQRRIERRLAGTGLATVLADLAKAGTVCTPHDIAVRSRGARTVRAFEYARLLRSAANRCLPRSIALALCLGREGVRADVVIAVKLGPFAAHCWAQIGDQVLNDTPEEVARFTPILVA